MNSQQCQTMLVALKSGCQNDAEFWAAIAEMQQSTASVASSDAEGGGGKAHWTQTPEARAIQSQVMKAWWAAEAEKGGSGAAAGEAVRLAEQKKRGPKPLAERTPEQQAAHAAAKAARAAAKASGGASVAEPASGASSDAEGPKKPKKVKKAAEGGAEAPKEKRPPSAWNLLVTKTVSDMRQSGWQSWTDVKGVVWPSSKLATVKGAEQYVYDGGEHDGKPPSPALGGMVRASWLKGQVAPIEGLQGEWAEE